MKTRKSLQPFGCNVLLPALLSALLVACGGGGEDAVNAASASATASEAEPSNAVPADAKVAPLSFMLVGTADGFVASQVAQSLSEGAEDKYDILVVGRNLAGEAKAQSTIEKALADGKTVILDGNPDGGSSQETNKALAAITGATVESDAYMIQVAKESKGYLLTPIDSPKTHVSQQAKITKQQATAGNSADAAAESTNNTLSNLLGLNLNGGKQ